MWSDRYHTSRSVWATSAIAAATLHAGVIGWGMTTWRSQRTNVQPASIRVIALSADPNAGFGLGPPAVPEVSPASASDEADAQDLLAPVAPTEDGLPQSRPVVTEPEEVPVVSPAEPGRSQPPLSPTVSSQPADITESMTTPETVPPREASPSDEIPTLPPVDPVQNTDRPFTTTPEDMTADVGLGLQADWQLELQGGDIPEELPQLAAGWTQTMDAVLNNASCYADLVNSETTLLARVRPVVEADGSISEIRPVSAGDRMSSGILTQCLQAIAPQMPLLIPARDGGMPIVSDAMVLIVEVRPVQ